VVVGAGAKILGPITIGRKARVGANSVVIAPVPEGKTVVGIPGKVVQSDRPAADALEGIDLNHHLIPDPVADAVSCLLERIRVLEQQVGIDSAAAEDEECVECTAQQVCDPS
jgi:serine O-acetyltransferase